MSTTPKTDECWADALARPSQLGNWKYVAEEMKALALAQERELCRLGQCEDFGGRYFSEDQITGIRRASYETGYESGLGDAADFVGHLQRQLAWSRRTFGADGDRTRGLVNHIGKELGEIMACGGTDVEEWIDVVILALDGAMRSGHTPAQVWEALKHKQAKNEARKWPDWRTAAPGSAIEHIREDK